MTIRAGTARSIVASLACGVSLDDACDAAMRDLGALAGTEPAAMPVNIVAIDAVGAHCSISNEEGQQFVLQHDGMAVPELRAASGSHALSGHGRAAVLLCQPASAHGSRRGGSVVGQ